MDIFKKLQDIKKRPGMYLGRDSLDLLKAYMDGWISAHQELNCNLDLSFFSDFQTYIQDYYKVLSDQNWANIIKFYSVDDREALDLFYVHLEKFINIRESNRPI